MSEEKKDAQYRVVFLQDGELVLRPVEEGDECALTSWINDPQISQNLMVYLPMTHLFEREWIAQSSKGSPNNVVLLMEYQGERAGVVGLHDIKWRDRTATLGLYVGEPRLWHKGIARKTLQLVLGYAFDTLDLHKVTLSVLSSNGRAYEIYERSGFQEEGTLKENCFRNGERVDEIYMSIFARDWRKQHTK
jgi:RimJ/RimL family protein N-acetyltransferase